VPGWGAGLLVVRGHRGVLLVIGWANEWSKRFLHAAGVVLIATSFGGDRFDLYIPPATPEFRIYLEGVSSYLPKSMIYVRLGDTNHFFASRFTLFKIYAISSESLS
jgi:hypothetical protein